MWTKHSGFKSRAAACLQQFEKKNGAWSQTKNDSNTSVLPHPCDSHTFPLFPTFRVSKRDFCLSDFYKHQNHLYMRDIHTPARKLPASSTSLRSAPIGLHPLGMRALRYAQGTSVLATQCLHTQPARTLHGEGAGKKAPSAQGLVKDNL